MAATAWALLCGLLLAVGVADAATKYNPEVWNQAKLLKVTDAPKKYFDESSYESSANTWVEPMFPTVGYNPFVQCKGPGAKSLDFTKERAGACKYAPNGDGATYTYIEKQQGERARLSNCYCYATDTFTGGWCYPGVGGGVGPLVQEKMSCADLTKRVIADGGVAVSEAQALKGQPKEGHYISLMFRSEKACAGSARCSLDFHFLRKDSNGFWSQKLGEAPVTNTDSKGNTITSPKTVAADGGYDHFCGYFHVVPGKMKVGKVQVPDGVSMGINRWKNKGLTIKAEPLPYNDQVDGTNYYVQMERLQQQQRGRKLLSRSGFYAM